MGTPKLAGHTVQGTLGSPVRYTGLASLLGNAPVVMTRILQEAMFMRCFTTGNLLVVFGLCQTGLQRLEFWKHTGGHMKPSLLPSELRLEAELGSHCLLGHSSGIKDMSRAAGLWCLHHKQTLSTLSSSPGSGCLAIVTPPT